VESNQQNDLPPRELRNLVERIKRGNCVLVLGPRVAVRADDPSRRPLDELLASELLKDLGSLENKAASSPVTLRRAAELYLQKKIGDRVSLELDVRDFYAREARATTNFHRDLAKLPFKLCISTLPDNLMLTAFKEVGKSPQKGYYDFRGISCTQLSSPTSDKPLVYYLFGDDEELASLVLTEDDLIKFLIAIARSTPKIPDHVRSILSPKDASFLFLGFGFQNWYLRVLLQVLNVYGHEKAIAFEDKQFFDHPEHEQTVGFFTGDRNIDFRVLRWEAFAQQLREAYEISTPRKTPEANPAYESPPTNGPLVFLSYASEDRDTVEALAGQLEKQGIRVWQDKQNLRVGDIWNPQLLHVIGKVVDYVIVVQTPMMLGRVEGVFNEEITTALKRHSGYGEYEGQKLRFLLPVKIGNCNLKSDLQIFHAIDVSEPAGVDSLVTSILEDWDRRTALRMKAGAPTLS
jgi:hypothetical protein